MYHSAVEYLRNVIVVERVDDFSSLAAAFHEFGRFKDAELVRYGVFRHIDALANIAYAKLAALENEQNFRAGRIAENFEQFRNVVDYVRLRDF